MKKKITKILSFLVCFCLILEQCSFAQLAAELNMGKYFSSLSGALTQERMRPVHLRYISYDNLNDDFRLLLDKGNAKNLSAPYLEEATQTLLKYFFVGLSLPNEAFWVNLRPDSPDNIIEDNLAQTDVGRIMLDADVQLKKDTAGFTSPHTPEGKEYWQRLYKRAEELFGTENVSIPTMIRPWIVPDEVIIREAVDNAYIYKATLKVMLEQDYLKGSMVYGFEDQRLKSLNEYASELMRELIIPKITRDVNTAQRYAPLRQVYYSLILAQWFKKKFFGSPGMYTSMINRKNLAGFTSQQPWSKSTYFQAYQSSFKEGEYNLKTPIYTAMGQSIRTYMSGGLSFQGMIDPSQNPGVEIVPAGNRNIPGAVGYSGALSNVLSQMVVNKRGVVKEEPITPSSSASPVTSGSSSIQAPAEDGQLSVEQMFARLTEKLGARITVDRLMNEIRSFSSGVQYSGLEEAGISPSGLPGLADSQALSYIANKLDELGIADARSAAELAIRYYEMGGYAEFDSLVELGPDQTLTMRTGDRIDANPTSAKNKNLAAPRMVVASFNNGRVDGADITFGYFSNLFYEFFNRALPGSVFTKDQIGVFFGLSQNRALIPEVEKFLKEKGFILVEDANVFFAVRPLYVIVRNKTEYQATKELLDVAFNDGKNQRTMNMLKQVSEKVASSDKNSVYNIINIEEVKDFSVFSVSGETIDVQVSSIGPQGEFELTGRSPSGWQETYRVMPGLSDSIEGDYVYRTQELTPGQTERMLSGEDARLQVTGLGTGDATTIDKDYTNLMTTMGSERVLTDFSVESIYKLKRLGLLNPKNIQTMILTHNHADHNAGFIQLILELYNQAVQEAGPVATQEEITRLAQARINQYTMVMAPAVKEGLVRIIGAQLLGREGELDYPLARAGYWRAQAAKLLENIPDLMPLSVNGQAKEYKFIDEKKGLTIHFHETDHFIATYGYVLHREGYGSAAYVGDTQNINDFNWAVETLEKYDPEGTNSILISEQGNVGHLTLPMIFKAVSFSEYASKLTIRLVHTSLRDVPEEVEGISLGNIEVLAQGDTVAAKGSEDSASSALEEDKTAAYWGLIGEASAVTKDAIEKFSLRPNEEVYVESGGSVFRLSVADNHAVLMPYLKKVGRTQYADVGGAKENLMIFKVGEERCVVGSVKDALAEGGKAGDVLYSNHKFTRAGNEGGLSGKAFALKVSKEGVKYYFTVEHFSASYTQTNIFGAEKALSSAGQVAFNAYSKEGEIIEFRAYPRGRHYLTRLGDGQYRSAKDITSAIEEISGELKSHKI
ncbi:MAG: hypothetical protein KKE64_00440, partial [Candidatus Omnitrophica bacterium]|nr:hypothetical protein [Candidatus Omnitrophota bacterium]